MASPLVVALLAGGAVAGLVALANDTPNRAQVVSISNGKLYRYWVAITGVGEAYVEGAVSGLTLGGATSPEVLRRENPMRIAYTMRATRDTTVTLNQPYLIKVGGVSAVLTFERYAPLAG